MGGEEKRDKKDSSTRLQRFHLLLKDIEREFAALEEENEQLRKKLAQVEEKEVVDHVPTAVTKAPSQKKTFFDPSPAQALPLPSKKSDSWIVTRELSGHRDGVLEVTECPWIVNSNILGSASADRTARLWYIYGNFSDVVYLGHKGAINSIRFHPQEKLVCTASGDRTVHIWKPVLQKPKKQQINVSTAKTPMKEKKTKLWSPLLEKLNEDGEIFDMECNPNVITKRNSLLENNEERNPVNAEQPPSHEPTPDNVQEEPLTTVRTPIVELSGHRGPVTAADFILNGAQVVSSSWDQTVRVFDLERSSIVTQYAVPLEENHLLTNLTVFENNQSPLISVGCTNGQILSMDARNSISQPVFITEAHEGGANSVLILPDGKTMLSGGDDRALRIWDIRNSKQPTNTIRCSAGINRFAVSSISTTIAIPLDDCRTKLCELSGTRLGNLRSHAKGAHSAMITGTAWSHDESVVYTASVERSRNIIAWTKEKKYHKRTITGGK